MAMIDHEQFAIQNAKQGDYTEVQVLLLECCDQLRRRFSAEIPQDLRQILAVDDVLQEICVEAIRDIHLFEWRGAGSFQSWLNELARNCLLDLVRTHRRKKRGGDRVGFHLSWVDVAEAVMTNPNRTESAATPSRAAHTKEVVHAVQMAVSLLPENERLAMRLYYLQQWPTEQIARELNVSSGAVRALLQRARHRLASLLGPSSAWLSRGN